MMIVMTELDEKYEALQSWKTRSIFLRKYGQR